MEKKNKRPASRPVGGAERRPDAGRARSGNADPSKGKAPMMNRPQTQKRPVAGQKAGQAPVKNVQRQDAGWTYPDRRPGAGPQRPTQFGYTQIPLRPMTSMPNPKKPLQQGSAVRHQPQAQRPRVGQHPEKVRRPYEPAVQQRGNIPPRPQNGERRPPQSGQYGRPVGERPPQKRPLQQRDWIVPEGSPVYTAEGRMYEGRQPARAGAGPKNGGADPRQQRRRPPERRPEPPKKKKKRFNKEKFFHGVKTFFVRLLTMLLVVLLIGFWWYRAEFFSNSSSRSGKVTFYMEDRGEYTVKAENAYLGDVLYVDFSEVAGWFGMVSVGSVNSMRFICVDEVSKTSAGGGGEEYAIFTSGSTNAVVNGTSISLEDVCRTVDTHIWIPLSFIESYMNGVECDRGPSDSNIVFAPEGEADKDEDKKDDEEKETELIVSYKVKAQNPLSPVEYPA